MNRRMTQREEHLVRWMLEHGGERARELAPQLADATVSPWRCGCGCPSFNLQIGEMPETDGGLEIVADFEFGEGDDLSGIFVFERGGRLAGVEVYGFAGDPPGVLPIPRDLRPFLPSKQPGPVPPAGARPSTVPRAEPLTTRNRIFCALLAMILGAAGVNALFGAPGGLWLGIPLTTIGLLAAIAAVRGGARRWYRIFL